MGWDYYGFKPYVSVAERRAKAAKEISRRFKKGNAAAPVRIEGRTITSTFWGQAWCKNLENYSDFANRLPRGRTYVRNGSVVHLTFSKRRITALVSGSELYEVQIDIAPLPKATWLGLKKQCAGQIGSLVELLQGKLSTAVMQLVTNPSQGLFPKPSEIEIRCSCPDYAGMCKHVAAVMYGVGNRLDSSPELLFALRAVDHLALIEQEFSAPTKGTGTGGPLLAAADLGAIFDIEMAEAPVTDVGSENPKAIGAKATRKKSVKKKVSAPKKRATIKKKGGARPAKAR
jgi:uncharacterized Zn finger protein